MKPSVRDRARSLAERNAYISEMYLVLSAKCEAVERLLAAHHGSDTVTEAQIELCVTCSPLLHK